MNFIDFPFSFTSHPIKKTLSTLKNEKAINQAIRNVLLTNNFERRMEPEFGCGIRNILFEPITPISAIGIQKQIVTALNNFEPRIEIIDVEVLPFPDDNYYRVNIVYFISNSENPIEFTFFLNRVR